LVITEIDVEALANTCIRQLIAVAEESRVQLSSSFPKGNHTIRADLISLRRVLMNLLSNGIKFTGSGGRVTVSGGALGDLYALEVKDTGSGMSQGELEALFQKFSQGKLGRKYPAGTGLG